MPTFRVGTLFCCSAIARRPLRHCEEGVPDVAISLRHCEEGMPDAVISLAYSVILSNAKDLLTGNTLCALSLVGFEGILHFVQNDRPTMAQKKWEVR